MKSLRTVAREAAEQTPADRDRILDVLRGFAILGVVGGHVIMAMTLWKGDLPELGNVLASSNLLQLLTWVLQVMPMFFIAGGAASYLSWQSAQRKNVAYSEWLWKRMTRLLSPVFFYLVIMAPVGGLVSRVVDPVLATPLLNLTTQLLWFLGVYLVITALTPLLASLHQRFGRMQIIGWFCIVIASDFIRLQLHGPQAVGLINFVSVWAVASVCGIWYLEFAANRNVLVAIIVIGIALNVALVFYGPYPVSLVGMPNEAFSNMAPPSLVMAIHTMVMWAGIELLRERLRTISNRPRLWRMMVSVNLSAMTIYLWHLPMLIVVTVTAHALELSPPVQKVDGTLLPTTGYWSHAIPLWIVVWTLVYIVVHLLWVTEHVSWPFFGIKTHVPAQRWRTSVAGFGVTATGIGLLLVSASGFSEFPTKVTEFAGLQWSSGFAVGVVLAGTICVKTATVLAQPTNLSK